MHINVENATPYVKANNQTETGKTRVTCTIQVEVGRKSESSYKPHKFGRSIFPYFCNYYS